MCINKDKENCTPEEVHEKVFLMFELGAEEWLDFPTVYGSAK
jgi:GTP-binding protein